MKSIKLAFILMATCLAGCSPMLPPVTPNNPARYVESTLTPAPTRTPRNTLIPTVPPSQETNLYGIPYRSPEWLILPRDENHPFNVLVLRTDGNCTLTINSKTDFTDLIQISEEFTLGSHAWEMLQTFDGDAQLDEIYYPDAYPPEYIQGGGTSGNGYAITGFNDSCRSAIQAILAKMN